MPAPFKLLICSDVHYASEAERRRRNYELAAIHNPLQRLAVLFYRRYFWLRDPFAHNALLDHVIRTPLEPDLAIANGDYSCDSAFIGVADDAARQSAQECLGKLRSRFGERFRAVYGDHELGKVSLCGGQGGLRLESLRLAQSELNLEPFWFERKGRYHLLGITSSLAAMPVYERETLDHERAEWRERSREHTAAIGKFFSQVRDGEKVLLFCHDPTALPFLWNLESVRSRSAQIERTVIGHLHSELILRQGRLLSWMPKLTGCGTTVARISSALSKAKEWRHFRILLCPSLSGIELTKTGGFYSADLDLDGKEPAKFQLHKVKR